MRNLGSTEIQFDHSRDAYVLISRPTLAFMRCTDFVGSFFEPFDPKKVSERLASINSYRGRTALSLRQEWDKSCREGIRIHEEIAQFFQHAYEPGTSKARRAIHWLQQAYSDQFHDCLAESVVYDEHLALAGRIDLLLRKKQSNRCIIIDWKTNRSISQKAYNDKRGIRGPARAWADCDYIKYSLQLSLYRYLLEAHYGLSVDEQFLVHLTDTSVKKVPCTYMKREVEQMLAFAGLTPCLSDQAKPLPVE